MHDNIHCQILLLVPLPSLSHAYSLLLQDEAQHVAQATLSPIDVVALPATSTPPSSTHIDSLSIASAYISQLGNQKGCSMEQCAHCNYDIPTHNSGPNQKKKKKEQETLKGILLLSTFSVKTKL